MIIMIIIIISIISFILIFWMQYPYIKNEKDDKNVTTLKYIYDIVKIPLIVVCLILFIYNLNSCVVPEKKLDIDLSLPNF